LTGPPEKPPAVAVDDPAAQAPGTQGTPARGEASLAPTGRLEVDRVDLIAMGAFLVVAFVLRFFSPIMPDFFMRPLQSAPVGNCVQNTPVDSHNHTGTLCGLAYPFQRNTSTATLPPTPPEGEVFDEIYFAVFAHDDLKGVSYFDPEPPLAKEIIAAGEWLDGAYRAVFQGAHGDFADLGFNAFGWRIMSCIFGTLCVPLMYLLALQLWRERWFALTAATLCCFDGMFFIQSRIGMIDIFSIFFIMLAYTLFLVHLKARSERDSLVTLLLTGLVIALAIAAKWIALAALASIVFFLVMRPLARHVSVSLGRGERPWRWGGLEGPSLPGGARAGRYLGTAAIALVAFPVAIYVASWFPFFVRGQFHGLGDLIAYNKQAYIYHATLTATHPYGSAWFSWPFLYRPVAYYYEYQGLGADAVSGHPLVAGMVDLGNPLIWWLSIPALLSLPYFVLRHRSFPAAVILLGFVTQYLPWSRVTRVIFLYHMFAGLIFMLLALAFVLVRIQRAGPLRVDFFGDRMEVSTRWVVPAFLVLVVVSFLFFYPVWTALPISDTSYLSGFPTGKMWLRTWI
jgi:dolichyl-phosphate-mannose--protein O-mannosyl transferase